jgi:hypothetical protein
MFEKLSAPSLVFTGYFQPLCFSFSRRELITGFWILMLWVVDGADVQQPNAVATGRRTWCCLTSAVTHAHLPSASPAAIRVFHSSRPAWLWINQMRENLPRYQPRPGHSKRRRWDACMHLWINLTSGARVIKLEISARDKRPVHSAVQDCCFGHSERYAASQKGHEIRPNSGRRKDRNS